ncbi:MULTISPECIES: hypothetical protein [Fischerella]|uniref:Uncharacterized protein n=1 Tax=Fischerella muscicola CCMEE 5323 TaxID=2019572 RepID=A0A2N6JY61_FISMU|nr:MULTISPECIES: hypothetical protein [Fischerella]MBD2434191.1 hypothetical protein [Fischerella sp. FACHB-380]PLZ85722.1 hypothetical protein CEN44_21735 [Fischerella muscicola CCMEE 5323]
MKAEVAANKTEVATGNVNKDRLFSEVHCLIFVSAITPNVSRFNCKKIVTYFFSVVALLQDSFLRQ